ncbi:hypothetical protein VCBJG01_0238, partial [Vibrio cholerae BJG-01]
MMSYPVLIFL